MVPQIYIFLIGQLTYRIYCKSNDFCTTLTQFLHESNYYYYYFFFMINHWIVFQHLGNKYSMVDLKKKSC
jgi:hypothetical protein